MVIKQWLIAVAVTVSVSACTSSQKLYKGLSKNKASLKYLYDPKSASSEKTSIICIQKPVINDVHFTLPGSLRKVSGRFLPLIIYNEWKSTYDYRIGKAVIQEDVSSFVRTAFIEHSKRHGTYTADTTSTLDGLELEIEIDSLGAGGRYISDGYFIMLLLAYSYGVHETIQDGEAYSRFHYTLKKNGAVLKESYVSNRAVATPLSRNQGSLGRLRNFCTTNLVEALSFTFRENLKVIVNDLNVFLNQNVNQINPTSD